MSNGDKLLEEWFKVKSDLKELALRENKIKERISKYMKSKNVNTIKTDNYQVISKEQSRETLCKKDCPSEVWNKYSKKSVFNVLKLNYLGEEIDDSL